MLIKVTNVFELIIYTYSCQWSRASSLSRELIACRLVTCYTPYHVTLLHVDCCMTTLMVIQCTVIYFLLFSLSYTLVDNVYDQSLMISSWFLVHDKLASNDPVIIPYMVINSIFSTLYGIITRLLSTDYCDYTL